MMHCREGRLMFVKTDASILRERVVDCMRVINTLNPYMPVEIGDVLMADVYDSNIVATENIELESGTGGI